MPEEEKLFYTIGEAAQILNVKPYVLRYWETEVKKLSPQKSETGQRTYRKKDLQVALTLKRLLYDEKYTIAGAIIKLDELEKVGLDQLSMFGAPASPTVKKEGLSPATQAEDPEPLPLQPPQNPNFSQEKVRELKSLIQVSHSILKKYNLV